MEPYRVELLINKPVVVIMKFVKLAYKRKLTARLWGHGVKQIIEAL